MSTQILVDALEKIACYEQGDHMPSLDEPASAREAREALAKYYHSRAEVCVVCGHPDHKGKLCEVVDEHGDLCCCDYGIP